MNTKILMSASAIVLGAIGILLSFFPDEILEYTGASSVSFFQLILQLLGAGYLGFAMLNWMARGNLIGGIYSRPIAIGNLMHFIVAGLALLKTAYGSQGTTVVWVAAALFLVFAVLFAMVTFRHPLQSKEAVA
ncbi:hypothetical protein JAO76_10300 [Pontibacter sp. BT310]|uniref:Uncharacterized protein n=1 Tax=Pontibacter populi TaxID=890055 RepID=A0ABS6XBT1_9BACT|nr:MULTISPECIES: hypothetical protein [Pontibacter]MBJ6118584.1 hypothetical protein [Pontibacter sp. BT310]MBR0571013.1 hypothetical protein [Microvirga sp. STS03]MBW3365438.1 hypothetical protein [Pontibacter populi]